MPNLRHPPVLRSQTNQFVRLAQRRRHRLFDQHVNPSFHQGARHLQMQNRRHRHRSRLHFAARRQHLLDRAKRRAAKLARHRVGPSHIRIDHPHQPHAARLLQLLIDPSMIPPECAHPNHRNIDRQYIARKFSARKFSAQMSAPEGTNNALLSHETTQGRGTRPEFRLQR